MFTAQVFTHEFTSTRTICCSEVRLVVPPHSGWSGAEYHFLALEDVVCPAASLSEITAGEALFPVLIDDGGGSVLGPFEAHGVTTQIPFGACCFIYRKLENGFWSGVTVALAYGQLVVREYECDPA